MLAILDSRVLPCMFGNTCVSRCDLRNANIYSLACDDVVSTHDFFLSRDEWALGIPLSLSPLDILQFKLDACFLRCLVLYFTILSHDGLQLLPDTGISE